MPDPDFGRITDERVRRLRDRIGVDLDPANFEPPDEDPAGWRPAPTGFNHEVTADGVRHFVNGYGDDDPLYCDPEYAAGTPWRGLIAPPTFVWSMYLPPRDDDITYGGGDEPPRRLKPGTRERFRGDPLRGTGALQSRLEYEFYRPLRAGDQLFAKRSLLAVDEKESSWGGRAVHVTWGLVTWNQRRELVHLQRGTWVKTERREVRNGAAGGRKRVQPPADPYTAEQLAEIDAAYAAEERRGAEVRYWEDVEVGEELPGRVKGPLRLTDVILWHAGFGQAFPTYAFRLAYEKRKQTPGLYTPNEYNVPDIVQRMHWDAEWARKVGAAERYDYGALRETWLCQLVTDWAGDASYITSLEAEHRRFNYVGDTTWLRGRVVGKTREGGLPRVQLSVWCENQRGEVTSPATATVALPSRGDGDLAMPAPPADDPLDLLRLEIDRLKSTGA
ncbi:FAS1-like dehydratase domain-containing protein [Actinomadura livida]|uniref:Acyl dehydratase n=1 Tax=Actinomadura livida TaxID=79909 RepID=A0A7W7ICU0_9ACTN|nr:MULTISPECIES: MaoC family dehydratase N-terminal domain-containing protein [Actinomadura]MBB4774718.1 acyl dehydratase [Actinomadura catellatispora]GGU06441.1 acyl dehydratase [Actinomadura livida]